jgi:hypothetical protein
VRDREYFQAHGDYDGIVGTPDPEDEYSDEGEDEDEDEEEDGAAGRAVGWDNTPITHYFFLLRCILYRRSSQVEDPNDPDAPKIRTETEKDKTQRDNFVSMLRSLGATTVTSDSFEFFYDVGYHNFPVVIKQVNHPPSPLRGASESDVR